MWPILCMVSAHVSIHGTLLLKYEASRKNMWPTPCMVSAHVSNQVTLLLNNEVTRSAYGPYPVWFQPMCTSRLPPPAPHPSSKLHGPAQVQYTPQTIVSIPCLVPMHVTHKVALQLEHLTTKSTHDPYHSWFQGKCLTRFYCSSNI